MRSRSRYRPVVVAFAACLATGMPGAATDVASDHAPRAVVLQQSDVKEDFSADDALRIKRPAEELGGSAKARSTQSVAGETEPNNTSATATPLTGSNLVVRANVYPVGDQDYFSFTATAGDTVFAATQTYASPTGGSQDTTLSLIASDGVTEVEKDDDNGAMSGLSSSLAATRIATTGTYYLRVLGFNSQRPITPYFLHFRLQSGAPTAETEPNNTTAQAQALPANGYVSGAIATVGDNDLFRISLNAGDTVYLGLDLDPERDNTECDGRLGLGLFAGQFLIVDDGGLTDSIPSETMFLTVKAAGTYYVYIDGNLVGSCGNATSTYRLSVSVHPAVAPCTVVTSTDVPKPIPDNGSTTSVISVPAGTRASDVTVDLTINHANPPDLDVNLVSPENNDNGLFVDTGDPAFPNVNVSLGDEAAFPIQSTTVTVPPVPVAPSPVMDGIVFQPGNDYRLHWYDGEDATGTWTLRLADDTPGATGTLTAWSLRICPTALPPACTGTAVQRVVYAEDFEANDGGYTHTGTQDEWEWGSPSFAPIDSCNGGSTNCWKTDLDDGYELNSTQDLESPVICLTGVAAPITASWAQRFQLEGASFDHAWVEVVDVAVSTNRTKLWEFMDGTMYTRQGTSIIQESAGWGVVTADLSAWAGREVKLRFHLDTDNIDNYNYAGFAIDDVTVTACQPLVDFVVGRGLGAPNDNEVRVYTPAMTFAGVSFLAYGSGQWGTNVHGGTLSGGATQEMLTGPGPGTVYGPHVRGWDRTGTPMGKVNFYAYGTLRYGVNVSSGELDGDVWDEIITGAGPGIVFGPHVRGWNFDNTTLSSMTKVSFYAYSTLRYGVNIDGANLDGDGWDEILTGAGPGVIFGTHVKGWNYDNTALSSIVKVNFFAFSTPTSQYGVNVAGSDVDVDCNAEILATPGPGNTTAYPSQFLGFNYDGVGVTAIAGYDILPWGAGTMYGGRVGTGDINADGSEDLMCGKGRDPAANAEVRTYSWNGTSLNPIPPGAFTPFTTLYGVNVSSSNLGY